MELAREIRDGESTVFVGSDDKLHRRVEKSRVVVTHGNLVFTEVEQVYTSGRVRSRNKSRVSEKKKPGETPVATALRGLKEEVKIVVGAERLQPVRKKGKPKTESSSTYPGLLDEKVRHDYTLELTDEEYDRLKDGHIEVQQDKKVIFAWREKAADEPIAA